LPAQGNFKLSAQLFFVSGLKTFPLTLAGLPVSRKKKEWEAIVNNKRW
jgi:hypothetical protein